MRTSLFILILVGILLIGAGFLGFGLALLRPHHGFLAPLYAGLVALGGGLVYECARLASQE
jgi:CHASE2 domain-containing sensor protein